MEEAIFSANVIDQVTKLDQYAVIFLCKPAVCSTISGFIGEHQHTRLKYIRLAAMCGCNAHCRPENKHAILKT